MFNGSRRCMKPSLFIGFSGEVPPRNNEILHLIFQGKNNQKLFQIFVAKSEKSSKWGRF